MIGTVAGLGLYPVKSLRGLSVDAARLRPWGFEGDRRWMVVDPEGRFVTQRSTPAMSLVHATHREDGCVALSAPGAGGVVLEPVGDVAPVEIWRDTVPARGADPAADRWLSARLDRPVRLVHLDDPARTRQIDTDFAGPGETVSFADGFPLLVTTTGSLAALNASMGMYAKRMKSNFLAYLA